MAQVRLKRTPFMVLGGMYILGLMGILTGVAVGMKKCVPEPAFPQQIKKAHNPLNQLPKENTR